MSRGTIMMKTIDFIFRYDPRNPDVKPPPANADEARAIMEEGNLLFARWTERCQTENAGASNFVIQCNPQELALPSAKGKVAIQQPFAVLLGCSDARVSVEMIFSQVMNNLFVVRVAGNVLSDECLGSVNYAVHHLSDSIRIIVVLGHTNCGAVKAAVDTYLEPWKYLSTTSRLSLSSIVDRIFVPVRKAANALESIWGPQAATMPGYHDALVETAVFVNAAQAAYNLRVEMALSKKEHIKVYYGVFDLLSHRIWTAPELDPSAATNEVRLAPAPADLNEFEELSMRVALQSTRKAAARPPVAGTK